MSARKHLRASLEGRSGQAPGLMRHGSYPSLAVPPTSSQALEQFPLPELLESKILAQAAEINQLSGENQRLAATHVALRQDLVDAQKEIQRLRAHIKSTQTESDIQMRVLVDKIAKYEADIRARGSIKIELQKAHTEAQSLVAARQELIVQVQQARGELRKAHVDAEKLPNLHAELDSLMREHQRLRTTFEYEKSLNIEKVRQMQAMEKNLFSLAREVEKLRAEVMNADKNGFAPNPQGSGSGNLMNPDPSYPSQRQGHGPFIDGFGIHHGQMGGVSAGERSTPHSNGGAVSSSGVNGAAFPSASSGVGW